MRSRLSQQKGYTLIESLIAASVFLIVATFTTFSMTQSVKMVHLFERRGEAIIATQNVLDELRVLDPTGLPNGGTVTSTNITIGTRTYRVDVTFCPAGSLYCSSPNIRHLKAKTYHDTTMLYEVDTLFAQLR